MACLKQVLPFFLVSAITVLAQSDRGTITGAITDPAGAVVANSAIEARNLQTGVTYPVVSTNTGNYTITQLPVGQYEVTATVPGFKKYTRSGITVAATQVVRIDIALEVGQASESITVQADASLLKTETADLVHNINVEALDNLPILGIGGANAGSSASAIRTVWPCSFRVRYTTRISRWWSTALPVIRRVTGLKARI